MMTECMCFFHTCTTVKDKLRYFEELWEANNIDISQNIFIYVSQKN